jgi:hypothetical protein
LGQFVFVVLDRRLDREALIDARVKLLGLGLKLAAGESPDRWQNVLRRET